PTTCLPSLLSPLSRAPPPSTLFPYTTLFRSIGMVGFDADDTLWRSQDYFDAAQAEFEHIVGAWTDLDGAGARERLYQVETGNIGDRKSTRLNSSHVKISYAVFCLKKKKENAK